MRMKPSSASAKPSRIKARNAVLLNLLGTPGLGSLLAGRVWEGIGQLCFFLPGFVLFTIWALTNVVHQSQLAFSETPPEPNTWGRKAVAGLVMCAVAWLWSLITSVSLHREAAAANAAAMKCFSAGMVKLDDAEIQTTLALLPQWQRNDAIIARTFVFKDFPAAVKFVNAIAEIAEAAQHHPDIDIRWNKVTLALTTHDAGGLTEKDFALAKQCDALALRS